ncbi:MAG: hypothetical protein P1V51_22655 [Deltaproteobacteria bacterium]|nr:hypothetical protein [Deltaproteobacteria bacterium]
MPPPLPAFVPPEDDTERFVRMTPEERLALLFELCDLTDSIVSARPGEAKLRAPTPRTESSLALWRELMQRARDG